MALEVSELKSGVFLATGYRTNWILVREGDSVTLVDAGWSKDYPLIVESLVRIGATPAQVEAVVLTHAHPDHVGVAERFRTEHEAPVHAHHDEVRHAAGDHRERVRILDLLMRLWRPSVMVWALHVFGEGAQHPTPVTDVVGFSDGPIDVPGGLVAVPTAGHTTGHCSFHLPQAGVVLTGDALVNENVLTGQPGPRLMPRIFSHDWRQAVASLDRLAPLESDLILPGHGSAMDMPIRNAVERAKQRLDEAGWWDR